MCNAVEQREHNFTWKKQQNLTVISTDVMFEVAGLTCKVPGLTPGKTRLNLTTAFNGYTINSAIADKLRDAFVQMQQRVWPPRSTLLPHVFTLPNLIVLGQMVWT